MSDWYVDATSGDDTTGDGLSWGTAWASLVKAFATITTPSAGDNQNIHIKGSHDIPVGGWAVTATNQPWAWNWNLRGYEGATITRTGGNIFTSLRTSVGFFDLNYVSNLATANYSVPGNVMQPFYFRCNFTRVGEFSYEGGTNSSLFDCALTPTNVSLQSMIFLSGCSVGCLIYLNNTVTRLERCDGLLNALGGNETSLIIRQCSFTTVTIPTAVSDRVVVDRSIIASGALGKVAEIVESALGTGVTYSEATPVDSVVSDDLFSTGFEPSDYIAGLSISDPMTIGAIQATGTGGGGGGYYNPFRNPVFGG